MIQSLLYIKTFVERFLSQRVWQNKRICILGIFCLILGFLPFFFVACGGGGSSASSGGSEGLEDSVDGLGKKGCEPGHIKDEQEGTCVQKVRSFTMGHDSFCMILDDGKGEESGPVKCWGGNNVGQLGVGNTKKQSSPQSVDLGEGRTAKFLETSGLHTCAILDDNSVKCWGSNTFGELGLEKRGGYMTTPQALDLEGDTVKSIRLAAYSTCILFTDNGLTCFSDKIEDIDFGGSIKDFRLGQRHICAILDDGSLKCRGYNNFSQLGIGKTKGKDYYPTAQLVNLGNGNTAKFIALGFDITCAILNDNSVKCWGRNDSGEVGVGDKRERELPTVVDLGKGQGAKFISATNEQACAILEDASVKCWGSTAGLAPSDKVIDLGGGTVKSIGLGYPYNCALLENGRVRCWQRGKLTSFLIPF